jgi:hypothetical protein
MSLPVYTFSVRKTDMRLDFMLECADQERVRKHCAKCFLVTYLIVFLSCRFMIRERSAGPCMISRFEHKYLLCEWKCVFVPCAKPAVYDDTKKVHALKVCMSAYLAHSHAQHKI